jgi:hypothetical protein
MHRIALSRKPVRASGRYGGRGYEAFRIDNTKTFV